MELKRPRGRPRKIREGEDIVYSTPPMPDPVILSIGIQKEKGLYSTFLMKTQGDKVIERILKQADIKESSLNMLYIEMLENFVDPNF